jgi:hypothetical protein
LEAADGAHHVRLVALAEQEPLAVGDQLRVVAGVPRGDHGDAQRQRLHDDVGAALLARGHRVKEGVDAAEEPLGHLLARDLALALGQRQEIGARGSGGGLGEVEALELALARGLEVAGEAQREATPRCRVRPRPGAPSLEVERVGDQVDVGVEGRKGREEGAVEHDDGVEARDVGPQPREVGAVGELDRAGAAHPEHVAPADRPRIWKMRMSK